MSICLVKLILRTWSCLLIPFVYGSETWKWRNFWYFSRPCRLGLFYIQSSCLFLICRFFLVNFQCLVGDVDEAYPVSYYMYLTLFQIKFPSLFLHYSQSGHMVLTAYPKRQLDVQKEEEEYGVRDIYTKIWKMTVLAKVKFLPILIWKPNSAITKISTAHFA